MEHTTIKYCTVLLLFLFNVQLCYTQFSPEEQRQIDSLNRVIKNKSFHDTAIANAYIGIAEILYVAFPDTMQTLSLKVLTISEKNLVRKNLKAQELKKFENLKASAQSNLAFFYMNKGEFEKSLVLFKTGLIVYEKQNDTEGMSSTFVNMAIIFHNTGKTDLSLEYYDKALKIATATKDKNAQAYCLHNMGAVHVSLGNVEKAVGLLKRSAVINKELKNLRGMAYDYQYLGIVFLNAGNIEKALDNFHTSLKLHEKTGDKYGISESLHNIATIYRDQKDIAKTVEAYKTCIKVSKESGNTIILASAYNGLGLIFESEHSYDSALVYFEKGLTLQTKMNNISGKAIVLQNLGSVYEDLKKNKKAIAYYEMSLKLRIQIGDLQGAGYSYDALSNLCRLDNKIAEAKRYAEKSMAIAKKLNYPRSLRGAAFSLGAIYKKMGKYKESLELYELYIQMRDSIANEQTRKAAFKKQFQYEYEKKAAADSVKNAEEQKVKDAQLTAQSASLKQEKTQRYALYGGLVLVVGFLGFVFNRFRVTNRQKIIIENQKQIVDEAFAKLHEKNKEVMDSIYYARRIQRALLTSEKYIHRQLNKRNGKSLF